MRTNWLGICGACVFAIVATANAQMKINADPASNAIFSTTNTGTAAADGIGVKGKSTPQPYWGIGVHGEGGYMGVRGIASVTGAGGRYGGYFIASGGATHNYGVAAAASGNASYAGYFLGNVHVTGTFTTPSDTRLKTDVRALEGPLDKIMARRPATYYFDNSMLNVGGLSQAKQIGLLAEDVESVLPELVSEIPVEDDDAESDAKQVPSAHGKETYQSVNYIGLIPVLIGAIKEQQTEIEALKAALANVHKSPR